MDADDQWRWLGRLGSVAAVVAAVLAAMALSSAREARDLAQLAASTAATGDGGFEVLQLREDLQLAGVLPASDELAALRASFHAQEAIAAAYASVEGPPFSASCEAWFTNPVLAALGASGPGDGGEHGMPAATAGDLLARVLETRTVEMAGDVATTVAADVRAALDDLPDDATAEDLAARVRASDERDRLVRFLDDVCAPEPPSRGEDGEVAVDDEPGEPDPLPTIPPAG